MVFTDNHTLCQKTEVNPLAATIKKTNFKKSSKYKHGEMMVEWKRRCDKDAMGNICSAGFIYFHFYTKQVYTV